MPIYTVQGPDGKSYDVEGPEGATAEQLGAFIGQQTSTKGYDVPSPVASLMNAGQSLTFGFGDEIAGKVGLDRNKYRATVDKFRDEYPVAAGVGSVSGAMLLPFGGAKALTAMNPWATAATIGGATGAIQGAGDAPESKDALSGAISQGAAGLALGPFAVGATKGVGMVAAPLASQIAARLPGAGQKYSEWLARNRVADAFTRDSTNADDVGRNMVGLGAEARVADGAGENTRGLLDLNANLPGRTKNDLEAVIRNRISTRPERLDDAVYSVNGGYGRAGEVSAALSEQKARVAGPLYQQLHETSVPVTDNLRSILTAAQELGATGTAQKIAKAERTPFTLSDIQQTLGSGQVSMRDADLIKRGLDDLIEGQTDAMTNKVSTLGRSYVKLKKDLVGELDTLTTKDGVSLYKSARDAFAGPAAMQSAIDRGRRVWNDDAEGIAGQLSGMSNSEQEAFRVGASEMLRQKFGSQSGQTQFLNQWKDRNVREKLLALLGDDVKYNDVIKRLRSEETLKRMEGLGATRNSKTFSREAGAEQQTMDNASDLLTAGLNAKTGGLASLLGGLGKYSSRVGTPEPVRDSIGRILMGRYHPAEMQALQMAQQAIAERRAAAAAAMGTAAGKSGLAGILDLF